VCATRCACAHARTHTHTCTLTHTHTHTHRDTHTYTHIHTHTHTHTRTHTHQVEKLQAKFEVVSTKHQGGPEDVGPDGQPHSQAYYVIKAAQEREELQREVGAAWS